MVINLTDKTAIDKIDPATVTAIRIESALSEAAIPPLRRMLEQNPDTTVALVTDPAVKGDLANLDIIKAVGFIRHLAVFSFSGEELKDLKPLANITSLHSFQLAGFYHKKINLSPLAQNTSLQKLTLEFGLADKAQVAFANGLNNLRELNVSVLDLQQMQPNPQLTFLAVTNTLKHVELLPTAYPALKRFYISFAKGVEDFGFIRNIPQLEALTIANTARLVTLPLLPRPEQLQSLMLINTKNFNDIDGLLRHTMLTQLSITENTNIPFDQISRLTALKQLKHVYVNFSTEADNERFEALAKEQGWKSTIINIRLT